MRPAYFASQPKRCAGGEAGLGGACLACGARPAQLCQAPPAERYKAQRRLRK